MTDQARTIKSRITDIAWKLWDRSRYVISYSTFAVLINIHHLMQCLEIYMYTIRVLFCIHIHQYKLPILPAGKCSNNSYFVAMCLISLSTCHIWKPRTQSLSSGCKQTSRLSLVVKLSVANKKLPVLIFEVFINCFLNVLYKYIFYYHQCVLFLQYNITV